MQLKMYLESQVITEVNSIQIPGEGVGFYVIPTLKRLYGDFPALLVDLRCPSMHYFRHDGATD